MRDMMQKMTAGMMKRGDMPRMMEKMMDDLSGKLSVNDRVEFFESTMPKCDSMILRELEPRQRKSLAEAKLQRMADALKAQQWFGTLELRKDAYANVGF